MSDPSEELRRTREALREAEARLEAEIADGVLLRKISSELIREENVEALYDKIVDAAVAIMRSDYASMQMLYPERGSGGELRLLAFRGFNPQAAKFWEWVRADSESTCGAALRTGRRVVAQDVTRCDFMAGTDDLATYLQTGIRAVQTTPLFSRSGRLVGMISTHWRAPHEPSERDLRLLDVLARQAADLIERSRSEQMLREADRRKDEFLAMLSHELRNPLAPIRHAVTLLQLADGDAGVRRQAYGILDRQVQHMIRLVDDLLDLSRISRGTIPLQKRAVVLAEVLAGAVETSRPLVEANGHTLDVSLPGQPLMVLADPVRLAQIVANVLNNAAKYTPRDGRIELGVRADGGMAAISVRDNGVGIAPEDLPHVFDPFAQAAGSRRRAPGGLGIGLALARQLVELHGGTIEPRSDGHGRGSEFVIRMPLLENVSAATAPATRPAAGPVRGMRILVAEDNGDAAQSLGMLLEQMGHSVRLAYEGEAALDAALRDPPEIIVLDIDLPKVDGYGVASRLRQDERFARVPIMAVSGFGQELDRKRASESGFDYHFTKPADPQAIQQAIERGRAAERPS